MLNDFLDGFEYFIPYATHAEIGEEWNSVNWDKRHHHIQYHRLYLLTEGQAKIFLYGKTIDLVPGQVYLVPAFSVIKSSIVGKMKKFYIHFQTKSPIFSLYSLISQKYQYPADAISEILFKTIVDNYTQTTPSAKLKVQGAMNILLSEFVNHIVTDAPAVKRFEPVLDYIENHYSSKIELSTLYGMLNISEAHFYAEFKRVFGVSPKQYILNKRITESQRLLLTTSMSIKEIAYSVGFDNENYFSEYFKQKIGVPANKFRKGVAPNLTIL